jgi:hypothetical protein
MQENKTATVLNDKPPDKPLKGSEDDISRPQKGKEQWGDTEMPMSQDERETRSPGGSPGPSVQRKTRTRKSPAPRDGANMSRPAHVPRDLTQWAYNE